MNELKFEKLYDLTIPTTETKSELYFQGNYQNEEGKIFIDKGNSIDLGTYFNAFSVKRWISYTTIRKLQIKLNLVGNFFVDLYGFDISGEEEILRLNCEGTIERTFDIRDFDDFDQLGIRLTALNDHCEFLGGEYFGAFESEREIKIGVTICTFKREKYLLPNLDRLKTLTDRNKNFNVMVIDNGQTLDEKISDELQIIHNRNFGGSGGFTRGIIEQVNQNKNTHIILMDDDIIIELSAFDRLYSILRHMKSDLVENFFAGAMLNVESPTIQVENTAYWNKIISKPFGEGFDLSNKHLICYNENVPDHSNNYSGWWFCCIPVDIVKKIGYPLPNFIKGDDIEYSLRNGKNILTLNGVAVWHEAFAKKLNPVMKFFSDRGMLLINHFAEGSGKFYFVVAVVLRILKRFIKFDLDSIRILEFALEDLNGGFEKITSIRADDKFSMLKSTPLNKNILSTIISILKLTFKHFNDYEKLDRDYKKFRDEKLSDQKFWLEYLDIKHFED